MVHKRVDKIPGGQVPLPDTILTTAGRRKQRGIRGYNTTNAFVSHWYWDR